MRTRTLTPGIQAILFGLLLAALLLPTTQMYPNGLIADDGYYYLQIAYNLGHHLFSSFDGLHQTSGYHLAWGAALASLAMGLSAFTASKMWFMFVALALSLSLAAYTAALFFRDRWIRLFALAFLIWSGSMTEALLLSLALLSIFRRALQHPREFPASWGDAMLISLVPVIRVDATIILAVFGSSLLLIERRRFAAFMAYLGIGLGLQLLLMKLSFGDFFSVSSHLLWNRSSGGNVDLLWRHAAENLWETPARTASCLFAAALAIYDLSLALRVRERTQAYQTGAIVFACLAFLFPHFLLGSMREWYFTAPILSLLLVAATEEGSPALARVLTTYCVVGSALIAVELATMNQRFWRDQAYTGAFISAVNRTVPASEKIFQEDASGFVGFWSVPHVVNGDGMVNSHDYMRRLAAQRLAGYLQEEEICFIIRDWPLEDDRIVAIGGLNVYSRDADLLFGPPSDVGASIGTQLKLYLLKDPRCARFTYLLTRHS